MKFSKKTKLKMVQGFVIIFMIFTEKYFDDEDDNILLVSIDL